jgi:hypothetical protein
MNSFWHLMNEHPEISQVIKYHTSHKANLYSSIKWMYEYHINY